MFIYTLKKYLDYDKNMDPLYKRKDIEVLQNDTVFGWYDTHTPV